MHNIFYINMATFEVSFCPLSVPYCLLLGKGCWEGLQKIESSSTFLFFQCFTVSVSGGMRMVVPVVMVVERVDATDACFFEILMPYSPFCYFVLCIT
jgi:hypothetical protein